MSFEEYKKMKKILLAFVLSVFLACSYDAFALATLNVDLDSTVKLNGSASFVLDGSYSYARVDDNLGNWAWDEDSDWPITAASAAIAAGQVDTATDFSSNPFDGSISNSMNLHPPGGRHVWGKSFAWGEVTFEATASGTFQSNLNVLGTVDLTTDIPGDWDSVSFYCVSYIDNITTNESHSALWQEDLWVQGGDDLSLAINQLVTAEVYLDAGDLGSIFCYVYILGDASSVIPAPGAVLLGTIGVGLVGWLKRRRIL